MTNTLQSSPFLREQRNFPADDSQSLQVEIDKAYIDIAQKVNSRTISTFPFGNQILNGEVWYLRGSATRQQGFRQVYTFTSAGDILHGIKVSGISGFTRIYGTFTDGTVWYPLPYVDATDVDNQVSLEVNQTEIVVTAGSGSPPSITSGFVILEWISNP